MTVCLLELIGYLYISLIWDLKFVREGVYSWLKVYVRHKCFLIWYVWEICLCLWEESFSKHVYLVDKLKSSRVCIAVCIKRGNWWKLFLLTSGPQSKWSYLAVNRHLVNCLSEGLVLHVSNKFVTYLAWSF